MACSYAWDVTPKDILEGRMPRLPGCPPEGTYVAIRTKMADVPGDRHVGAISMRLQDPDNSDVFLYAYTPWQVAPPPGRHHNATIIGRAPHEPGAGLKEGQWKSIDTGSSRFTGASVAGLVVGAMGVFVFGAALRHWLNRRRAFFVGQAEVEP
jgi:hypothetical protein